MRKIWRTQDEIFRRIVKFYIENRYLNATDEEAKKHEQKRRREKNWDKPKRLIYEPYTQEETENLQLIREQCEKENMTKHDLVASGIRVALRDREMLREETGDSGTVEGLSFNVEIDESVFQEYNKERCLDW